MTDAPKTKTALETAADVIDTIADVGTKIGAGIGGVAGTVTTVVSIGAGIVAAFLRVANPVVKITRMRDAIREAHAVDADVDVILATRGVS